ILRPALDEPLQPPEELWRDRHVANPAALAEDAHVRLPAGPDDVLRPELGQPFEAKPAIAEDADDKLVALAVDRPLHEVDLALGSAPRQEDLLERVAVGVADRALRQAAGLAVGEVVIDEALQRGRRSTGNGGDSHGSGLMEQIDAFSLERPRSQNRSLAATAW